MKKPVVWSIVGIDPTGLAGCHVDDPGMVTKQFLKIIREHVYG